MAPVGLGNSLRGALRAAASGQMTLTRRAAEALGSLLDHAVHWSDAGEAGEDDERATAQGVADATPAPARERREQRERKAKR